jgi:hypothetical protein
MLAVARLGKTRYNFRELRITSGNERVISNTVVETANPYADPDYGFDDGDSYGCSTGAAGMAAITLIAALVIRGKKRNKLKK